MTGYDLPPELTVEADGPVRTVTLDRPDQLNAVNEDMHRGLASVWSHLAGDRGARAVVLTGAGAAFSAGGDLGWITELDADAFARAASLRQVEQIIDEMLRFPLPVIAAVNGPAVGLGCSLAVLCDIVLIAESAHLADPHVTIGLAAGDGGAAMWPLLTPLLRSRELLFTGERIPAATAVELGLATRTVPDAELAERAHELAHRLARRPAVALQHTKQVLNLHLAQALAGPLRAGLAAEAHSMTTDDHRERLAALRRRETGDAPTGG